MTSVVELRDVTCRYAAGADPAVRNLSFAVQPGEILALLGPSGCGKSTTLRLIAGLELPDTGEIWLNGVRVAGGGRATPPEDRRLGMVFQDYALFPHLTAIENVVFGLHLLPPRERRTRAAAVLGMVGMAGLADRYPHQLSGGQQQRVALARALAPGPDLVLLDEPFSALDVALRAQLRGQVRSLLRHEGASALIVTHDQQEALSMADRVAVMHEGRIRQIGSPSEVYRRPVDRWVAEFVGDAVVLTADVTGGRAQTALGPRDVIGTSTGHVMLRPEQIRVGESGVEAVVEDVDFRGHEQIVQVRLAGGDTLAVRSVGDAEVPSPGSTVRVSAHGTAWGL